MYPAVGNDLESRCKSSAAHRDAYLTKALTSSSRRESMSSWPCPVLYLRIRNQLTDVQYRYVRVLAKINDLQCRVTPLRYSEVLAVDKELRETHEQLPPDLLYPEGSPTSNRPLRHDMQRLILRIFHAEAYVCHYSPTPDKSGNAYNRES